MNHQVNILVNGMPAGTQTIVGSPLNLEGGTGKVFLNNKEINEEVPIISPLLGQKTLPFDNVPSNQIWDEESFSIAENYSQWANLKKNPSLDKMFLVSTPDAETKLLTLHKYITELLYGEANIPKEFQHSDDLLAQEELQPQEDEMPTVEPEYVAVKAEDIIPKKGRVPKSFKPLIEETQEEKRLKFEAEKAAFLEAQKNKNKKKNLKTDL